MNSRIFIISNNGKFINLEDTSKNIKNTKLLIPNLKKLDIKICIFFDFWKIPSYFIFFFL